MSDSNTLPRCQEHIEPPRQCGACIHLKASDSGTSCYPGPIVKCQRAAVLPEENEI
jgi:hypothetical protein